MKNELQIIRYNIKVICREKGITQAEIASKLGITNISLSQTLSGSRSLPSLTTLARIADALGVSVANLLLQPNQTIVQDDDTSKQLQRISITCPHCKQAINLTIS